MSMVSKVFVVLNFIFAMAFMVATLTLYAKKVNWVQESIKNVQVRNALKYQLDELKERYDKDIASQNETIRQKISKIDNLNTEIAGLRSENEKYTRNNAELRAAVNQQASNLQALTSRFDDLKKSNDQLQADLDAMRKERDKAVAAREFAEVQAIETMADLKESEAELMQLAKKNHELVEEILQKDYLLEEARKRGFDPRVLMAGISKVPIAGRVLQVEEAVGLVILNVGEKDKVKPGMEFVISRGSQYVGKVRVRNTYHDMCSAVILPEVTKKPIEIADTAQTL